jgi:molybdate/tungstate transport system permease protein
MNGKRFEPAYLLFTALGGLVLLLVVAPLVAMFLRSSTGELLETARDAEVTRSIRITLLASMGATLLCAVASVPFAYILARKRFPLKQFVNGIIDLPIVIPHSAAGIALLGVISRGTLIGDLGEAVGIRFVGGYAGIMAAMAFVSVPFLVNAARDGFSAVPEQLEKAALNLGASPSRVFFTISVPIAWRSILSGLILMWARGMSEFGAVLVVAYHPMITPVLIYERFGAFGLKYARPVSVLFIAICLAFFVVLRLIAQRRDHVAG